MGGKWWIESYSKDKDVNSQGTQGNWTGEASDQPENITRRQQRRLLRQERKQGNSKHTQEDELEGLKTDEQNEKQAQLDQVKGELNQVKLSLRQQIKWSREDFRTEKKNHKKEFKEGKEELKKQLWQGEITRQEFKTEKTEQQDKKREWIREQREEKKEEIQGARQEASLQKKELRGQPKQVSKLKNVQKKGQNFKIDFGNLSGGSIFGNDVGKTLDNMKFSDSTDTIDALKSELIALQSISVVENSSREKKENVDVTQDNFQSQFEQKDMMKGVEVKDSSVTSWFFYNLYKNNRGVAPSGVADYLVKHIGELMNWEEFYKETDRTVFMDRVIDIIGDKYGTKDLIFSAVLKNPEVAVIENKWSVG